jgi:hypothetical protein
LKLLLQFGGKIARIVEGLETFCMLFSDWLPMASRTDSPLSTNVPADAPQYSTTTMRQSF